MSVMFTLEPPVSDLMMDVCACWLAPNSTSLISSMTSFLSLVGREAGGMGQRVARAAMGAGLRATSGCYLPTDVVRSRYQRGPMVLVKVYYSPEDYASLAALAMARRVKMSTLVRSLSVAAVRVAREER